jgi:pilus assembly protein CpaD
MTMRPIKSSAALIAVAMTATACGPVTNGLTPVSNPSLYSVNQPVVQRTDYVLDVNATGGGVPDAELARLDAWFDSIQLGYGDHVSIDTGGAYADAAARGDIASVVADYGLLLDEGAPVTAGAVQPGSVRVVVSRMTASVPGCPIWEDEIVGAPERTATNYGCATNSNLAQMIADPSDLVLGQAGSGDDSRTGSRAVKIYREKRPTGAGELKSETTGGK